MQRAKIGKDVIYHTDGRNGLAYDLPAKINCTQESHPGNYPDGSHNPLPVPESETHVHLTVFSPGGFGTTVDDPETDGEGFLPNPRSDQFIGATGMRPGSGTYVELNVPLGNGPRTWSWPVIS